MSADNNSDNIDVNKKISKLTEQSETHTQWPIAIVLIVFIAVCGFLLYQCTPAGLVGAGKGTADKAAETATKLIDAFRRENINFTFTDRLTEISKSQGALLEVAILKSVEGFKRSTTNWRGTTVSEVRVPAVFKYNVSLKDQWTIETRESENAKICIVLAPRLKPSVPVPILTHQMEKFSKEGWLRWDANEEMDVLISEITPQLSRRARAKMELARDKARLTIGEFTKTWLLEADHWRTDRFSVIQVVFQDELESEDSIESLEFRPTLILEQPQD